MFIVCPLGLHFQHAAMNAGLQVFQEQDLSSHTWHSDFEKSDGIFPKGPHSKICSLNRGPPPPPTPRPQYTLCFSQEYYGNKGLLPKWHPSRVFFGSQTFLKNKQKSQHNIPRRLDLDGLPTAKGRKSSVFASHLASGAVMPRCRKTNKQQTK